MIFKKIKLKKRLPFRVLCARIKDVIETIDAGQKSLIITNCKRKFFPTYFQSFSALLTLEHDRFLTHPDLKVGLIIIEPVHFDPYFADLITRLFPNVEQLFITR